MLSPVPGLTPSAWVAGVLAAFSHAGTAITIALVLMTGILATRCEGRCREDEVFRHHVV